MKLKKGAATRGAMYSSTNLPKYEVSFSENYEKSRNLYLSALVLQVRDKIEEIEEELKNKPNDVFWTQLETMISRHSAKMDRVAQQVYAYRSELNSKRKTTSQNHQDRMNKAKNKLKSIQKEIAEHKNQLLYADRGAEERETVQTNNQVETINLQIEQHKIQIKSLRKSTKELQTRIEQIKTSNESKSTDLGKKRIQLDMKAENLTTTLELLMRQIREADNELRNLDEREKICLSLYESLTEPLPTIERIFTQP